MQDETVLFQERDYSIYFDTLSHAGEKLFTGSEVMARVAKGAVETILYRCRNYVDNESVKIPLTGKTVDFYCKEYLTSTEIDLGGIPKELTKACTIVSAIDGEVDLVMDVLADLGNVVGKYNCHLIINDGADKQYSDYPFVLEIFVPGV